MIFALFGRSRNNRRVVDDTYIRLTEAARHPVFYERFGVPDTVMGRFEMVAAHMVLFLRRTGRGEGAVRAFAQEMVDTFFQDIDHSIREIGIGDTGVPKRMKKLARMFYGRMESYGAAMDAGDRNGLAAALARNIHPKGSVDPDSGTGRQMRALADHLVDAEAALAALCDEAIISGRLDIPAPREAASS